MNVGFFREARPAWGRWRNPARRKSVVDKIFETPFIWIDAVADTLLDLPPIRWFESRAKRAARLARRGAERVSETASGAVGSSRRDARRLRRAASGRLADARGAAGDTLQGLADELDRIGGKAARLSMAAGERARLRPRGWLARLLRAPTPGERVAEEAKRAGSAGTRLIADVAAPLFSLWLTISGRASHAADRAAEQARKAADLALDRRPRGPLSWLFAPKARRVERVKAKAAAARSQSATTLDEMRDKFEELRRRSVAVGDGETAKKARASLDRLSRLRVTIAEEPSPPNFLQTLARALGTQPEGPDSRVRSSAPLWPLGKGALARWDFGAKQSGATLGYAAAAVASVAAYALFQAVTSKAKGADFAQTNDHANPFAVAARSAEPGRGRAALSPSEIPWAGWKDILWRTYAEIGQDRLLAISAGVVFYGLLALFPAITALVSSYALFAAPETISQHLGFLQSALPPGAYSIVQDQIQRVVATADVKLGLSFLVSLLLALWSANAGVKAVIDALNIVYNEREKRGFFKLNAVSLAFTAGGVAAALVGIGAVVVVPIVVNAIGFGDGEKAAALVNILRWPVLVVLLLLGLAVLYRYGPSRREAQWRWLSVGAVAATVIWILGSFALSYYIAHFGNFDATYGSLGAAIGMMMWMWLSAIAVLFGAELNSEIEHQTARDSTIGASKPMGARGATMADTLGAAAD